MCMKMRFLILLNLFLLPLVTYAQTAPYAKSLGISDLDLLKHSPQTNGRKIKVRAHGVLQDEVDDYADFDNEALANGKGAKANHNLKQVTYKPIPQEYNIPSLDVEEKAYGASASASAGSSAGYAPRNGIPTLSPVPQAVAAQKTMAQGVPQARQGYYFQHYPWDRLPHRYLVRPGFQYVYPQQYQNAQYYYPATLPYQDPYNIYRSAGGCGGASGCGQGCGSTGCGQGCGGSSGCGQSSGGCGGGSGGYGQGCGGGGKDCVDCGEEYEESEEYDSDEDSAEDTEGGRSGEAHILNKKDPLDDLDLEDLERIDKEGSSERK